jgi:3-hydroxybutyryl-CoA dehydrogenase
MEIKKVGIIGCGAMGSGIGQVCAQSGYQVKVMEKNQEYLKKGLLLIESFINKGIEKGKISEKEKESILGRIKGVSEYSDFHDCDLIIEAVIEDIKIKREIFQAIDNVCGGHAIFATNTSSLSIIDLASATKRPEQVLGLHFFNPAPLMKLL